MEEKDSIKELIANIQTAMGLSKCRKCGCIKESLKIMKSELLSTGKDDFLALINELKTSIEKMEPIEYT